MSPSGVATFDATQSDEESSDEDGARWRHRRVVLGPWILGLVAALLTVGPGLRPGSWLNVDLVVTPVTPVPRGVWGIGPELPRRVPWALPLAWISSVFESPFPTKAVVVVAIAAAVAGAWRLAALWFDDLPPLAGAGAGLLFGLSPFLLTRLGVGHLPLVMVMGLLPWAMPTLLDPCRSLRRTFLWCVAIGLTGVLGGALALVVVPIGVLFRARFSARPAGRVVRSLGLVVLSQVPWLVPGALVLLQGAAPSATRDFATDAHGDGGLARVLAGHGFWRFSSQVGADQGWVVPVLGIALLGLAIVGLRGLARSVRRPAIGVAVVGLLIPLASSVPGLRGAYSVLVDSPVGATLREGQRLLPLYLVIAMPLAAGGAARLAARRPGWLEGVLLIAPVAIALTLAGPGLWGVNGTLDPVRIPATWTEARSIVNARPGTILSLPFRQYLPATAAKNRTVVDPMPVFLGGDVITSSNPGLSAPSQERADPREPRVNRAVNEVRGGRPVADDLARIGVRWVVLRHDFDWEDYDSLNRDEGLTRLVSGVGLDLYEVTPWPGSAIDGRERAVVVHQPAAPVASISGTGHVTWFRPGIDGWMRGRRLASTTPDGAVRLPAGSGPVWFWPSVITIFGDLSVVGVTLWAGLRSRLRRPMDP